MRKLAKVRSDSTGNTHYSKEGNRRVTLNTEEINFIEAVRNGEASVSLRQKIKQADNSSAIKKELKEAYKEILELERVYDIFEIASKHNIKVPSFLSKPKKSKGKHATTGTPCLFLSDLHHGEVVNPAEIGGVNTFNMEISEARINHVVDNGISLLNDYFANPQYTGFVMPLGGDMVSGNIHDELRETNGALILDVVLDLARILTEQIVKVRDTFGKVYVPCVVGNHGRLDKKPRAKGGVKDNFDYLLYKILEQAFSGDNKVSIDVSDGFDKRFDVNGHKFLLTHGNQFKGGSGVSGPLLPWKRNELKKKKNYEAIGQGFNTMIFGHFHTLMFQNGLIANGCTKGMDEWCFSMNFEFERPQQAMWIVQPNGTITYKMEVFAD